MAKMNSVKKFVIVSIEKELYITVYARGWKDIERLCKKFRITDSVVQLLNTVKGKSRIVSKENL